MMKVKIYYGLSGTFKGTTISAGHPTRVMWSAIKPWKHYLGGSFKDLVPSNNLTFALLHLVRMQDYLRGEGDLVIERGISDFLFYHDSRLSPKEVGRIMVEEDILLRGIEVERILLVQKDEDFIQEVVLREPTRREIFKDVPSYLEAQEKYVKWTKEFNKIDKEIEIHNAKDYIERVLGLDFKV